MKTIKIAALILLIAFFGSIIVATVEVVMEV